MRMISKESKRMVYHRPQCRYAKKMKKKNRVQMYWDVAEKRGYRPCKYCDSAKYMYGLAEGEVEYFAEIHGLDVDFVNNEIVVRTDAGCWKILYKKHRQQFMLLHRNHVNGRITLEEVNKVPFHHQGDVPYSKNIMKYMKYIQSHDEFKLHQVDYRTMPQVTARQKSYYRTARRRAEKQNARRLDSLFVLIEQKEGIKQLSFC